MLGKITFGRSPTIVEGLLPIVNLEKTSQLRRIRVHLFIFQGLTHLSKRICMLGILCET